MNYRCKIFDSKVPDVILTYALIYPSNFNRKGYVELKHQLYTSPPNPRDASVHLGLVLLVISIINNLCAKYDTILTLPV